jgi:hypothetical protein
VVQAVAFTALNTSVAGYVGRYFDLTRYSGDEKAASLRSKAAPEFQKNNDEFLLLPSSILCYWATERELELFRTAPAVSTVAEARHGMVTSNNDRFLRWWWEVDARKIEYECLSRSDARASRGKWFPYNKGGAYRKWFGNTGLVVNWENDGAEIFQLARDLYGSPSRKLPSQEFYFAPGLTWSALSSDNVSFRFNGAGYLFDSKGSSLFLSEYSEDELLYLLAFLNSRSAARLLNLLCPTLDYNAGSIAKLPLPSVSHVERQSIVEASGRLRELAKTDWDKSETSWDFQSIAVGLGSILDWKISGGEKIKKCRREMRDRLDQCEQIFQTRLDLDPNILPSTDERDLGFSDFDDEDLAKNLVSYAVGCIMGRYSLDETGVVYAGSANQAFDPGRYETVRADEDGILPVLELDWGFDDDAANRIVEFISRAWPEKHLEENLKLVADGLGVNVGELPRDTLRRYLSAGFYRHHLATYKKRPIYWLFSSGKSRAFQCLVYLHRYNEGTLARIRTSYVIPVQGHIASRIDQIEADKPKTISTSQRKKLQKEQDDLKKKQAELRVFEEKLKHYADQKISLDLDDGVKVNYGKFGDLLTDVKAITGGKDDE